MGRDPSLLKETMVQAGAQSRARLGELKVDQRSLERDLTRWHAEVRSVAEMSAGVDGKGPTVARLADLHERIRDAEQRLTETHEEIADLERDLIGEDEVERALGAFYPVWDTLAPHEQTRIVQLLVQRVDYDGSAGKIAITFHPAGIKTLAHGQMKEVCE